MKHNEQVQDKEQWERTKYVSWPPSQKKPWIRLPLPSGGCISRTVQPAETESETLARCRELRDKIALPIWGDRWYQMLSVPRRSVVQTRGNKRGDYYTGVHLRVRKGTAPCFVATWYESVDTTASEPESKTRGVWKPRKSRKKYFSFGTDRAMFSTEQEAYAAAVALRKQMERKYYSANNGVAYSSV